MARNFDDDASRRIRDADDLVHARQRDADERICVVTTNLVIDAQEKLARRRRLDRIWRAGWSRERSYFLQQSADAIEEAANAATWARRPTA